MQRAQTSHYVGRPATTERLAPAENPDKVADNRQRRWWGVTMRPLGRIRISSAPDHPYGTAMFQGWTSRM
jgi:hypothetical protein